MLTKKVKSRIFLILILLFLTSLILFVVLRSLKENVVYFLSPTEVYNTTDISSNTKIRIGGLVKENSISKKDMSLIFIITDLKKEIVVSYKGLIPNLFAEGKGVVAEGLLMDKKYFVADKILAKHDENYMPPEVNEALKGKK